MINRILGLIVMGVISTFTIATPINMLMGGNASAPSL
jgi:hypothetical protein